MLQTILGYFFIGSIALMLILALTVPFVTELSKAMRMVSAGRGFKIAAIMSMGIALIVVLGFLW